MAAGADLLEEHLGEIRNLRQRLEESICINDRLREQLEHRLSSAARGSGRRAPRPSSGPDWELLEGGPVGGRRRFKVLPWALPPQQPKAGKRGYPHFSDVPQLREGLSPQLSHLTSHPTLNLLPCAAGSSGPLSRARPVVEPGWDVVF